jgi:hypothetical protein
MQIANQIVCAVLLLMLHRRPMKIWNRNRSQHSLRKIFQKDMRNKI